MEVNIGWKYVSLNLEHHKSKHNICRGWLLNAHFRNVHARPKYMPWFFFTFNICFCFVFFGNDSGAKRQWKETPRSTPGWTMDNGHSKLQSQSIRLSSLICFMHPLARIPPLSRPSHTFTFGVLARKSEHICPSSYTYIWLVLMLHCHIHVQILLVSLLILPHKCVRVRVLRPHQKWFGCVMFLLTWCFSIFICIPFRFDGRRPWWQLEVCEAIFTLHSGHAAEALKIYFLYSAVRLPQIRIGSTYWELRRW